MKPETNPTNGITFRVAGRVYRCVLALSTMPTSLALYECQSCAGVTTDPRRHGPACSSPGERKLRAVGVAVTIPLPGRPE